MMIKHLKDEPCADHSKCVTRERIIVALIKATPLPINYRNSDATLN